VTLHCLLLLFLGCHLAARPVLHRNGAERKGSFIGCCVRMLGRSAAGLKNNSRSLYVNIRPCPSSVPAASSAATTRTDAPSTAHLPLSMPEAATKRVQGYEETNTRAASLFLSIALLRSCPRTMTPELPKCNCLSPISTTLSHISITAL
jgi:hypothetical protein